MVKNNKLLIIVKLRLWILIKFQLKIANVICDVKCEHI